MTNVREVLAELVACEEARLRYGRVEWDRMAGSDADFTPTRFAKAWSTARAALAQESEVGEVTVTCNEAGECVAVTRTDGEHRILSVIWKRKR